MIRGFPYGMMLNPLSQQQLDDIHEASLEILQKTGVKFEHEEALQILGEAGCDVNRDSQLVKFPSGLVEQCIRQVPSSFTLRAIDRQYDLTLGGNRVTFSSGTAVDLIHEVGPLPGNFLINGHTREHWKKEHMIPSLFHRAPLEQWLNEGAKDIVVVAREKVQKMLAELAPESRLPKEMDDEITRIMQAVEREKGLID